MIRMIMYSKYLGDDDKVELGLGQLKLNLSNDNLKDKVRELSELQTPPSYDKIQRANGRGGSTSSSIYDNIHVEDVEL